MKSPIPRLSLPFRGVLFLLVFLLAGAVSAQAKPRDKDRWDKKYDTQRYIFGTLPITFLEKNIDLLPRGKALDIAMGEGRNGVFLAKRGFDVLGIDISDVGLQKAHALAKANNVTIETKVVDLEGYQLEKNAYDVILCTYYMQRDLFPQIKEALKPGGMAIIETYNTDYLKYAGFPRKYLLDVNELLHTFKDMKIIRYQEFDNGKEAYSSILFQRPHQEQ